MAIKWAHEEAVISIPHSELVRDSLKLAFHLDRPMENRELIAVVSSPSIGLLVESNPKWVYSEGLKSIYAYVQGGDQFGLTDLRRLNLPSGIESLDIVISKWRPKKRFSIREAIGAVYLARERDGISIYELMEGDSIA